MLSLACVRLAKNCNRAVSRKLSSWRNYAANELIGSKLIPSKLKFVSSDDGRLLEHAYLGRNGQCDCYFPLIWKALEIEASKAVQAGAYAGDLKYGIEAARKEVRTYFERTARLVHTPEEIFQAATASVDGDVELGNLIAKGIQKVGKHGTYVVEKNKEPNNEVEFVHALDLSKWGNHMEDTSETLQKWKVFPPEFFTNKREKICLLENPLILVLANIYLNKTVVQAVLQAIRSANCTQPRPLLIIAEYVGERVEEGVEDFLMLDGSCPRGKLCIVKPPYGLFDNPNSWGEMLEDLAILTGGQVVTKESDMKFIPQMLGSCKKVRVSNLMMLIYDAAGDQKNLEKRCKQVGETCNLHRVDYAAWATQVAMEGRSFPGGGVAYLNASKELDKFQTSNSDAKFGVQVLQNVLKMPVYCSATAAGFNGSVVVEKLLEQDNPNIGFNPATGEFIDVIESGLVDEADSLTSQLEDGLSRFKRDFFNRSI